MLDYKINYILSKEDTIKSSIYQRLHNKLKIDGKADFSSILHITILFSLLNTGILTTNIQLQLYKKLIHLLRLFGIMYKIPDVINVTNPILYYGVGAQNLTVSQLQANLTQSIELFGNGIDISLIFNPTLEVFYFCYPQSLGELSSILDPDDDEVLNGFTQRSESFDIPDLGSILYYVYESESITTQGNFSLKFII